MRRGFLLGVLLGALITTAFALPLGAAGSDIDADLKTASKLGVTLASTLAPGGLKLKRLCACLDSSDVTAKNKPGMLAYTQTGHTGFNRIGIECYVPKYDPSTGARTDSTFCTEWVPLPK